MKRQIKIIPKFVSFQRPGAAQTNMKPKGCVLLSNAGNLESLENTFNCNDTDMMPNIPVPADVPHHTSTLK